MKVRMMFATAVLVSGIGFGIEPAAAQEFGGSTVVFKNDGQTPVKVCIYAGKGELYPFAVECMTLGARSTGRWDHQTRTRQFSLWVFEPGLLDEFRCRTLGLNDPSFVQINAKGAKTCVSSTPRLLAPPPDPNKRPYESRSDNMLAVCNISNPEPVFFAITYATGQTGYYTEGWWRLIKNQCLEINLEDLWYKQGLPVHSRFKTYIYGETEGRLGGAVKKVWEGDDPKFAFCINDDKVKTFGNKHQYPVVEGGVVWESDCASAPGKRIVKMWPVTVPKLGDPWKWNF